MARVSFVEKGQGVPMVEHRYRKMESEGQTLLNIHKVFGHCPNIGLSWQRLANSITKGDILSPRLRELAVLRIGDLTKSEYQFSQHTVMGLRAGLRREQIEAIHEWEGSAEFDGQERAVLAFADEVEGETGVNDETFAALGGFLDDRAVVELTAAISFYGMVCRLLVALEVDLES
jgi:alkylhydroperoxidase family enzyme